MIEEKNNEKTKCSLRRERDAVAKASPQKLFVVVVVAASSNVFHTESDFLTRLFNL